MRRILEEVGREELRRVRGLIGSSTLRKAVELLVDASKNEARLVIPHYWAEFYHDGRPGFGPATAKWLVFFADPEDDPRKPTPQRASQMRRLTEDEFNEGLQINGERKATGQPPYMYVVQSVGPAGKHPFFDQLAQGSATRNGPVIARIFDAEIQRLVDEDPDVKPERGTADFTL